MHVYTPPRMSVLQYPPWDQPMYFCSLITNLLYTCEFSTNEFFVIPINSLNMIVKWFGNDPSVTIMN